MESGGIFLPILNIGFRWNCIVSLTPLPLYLPGKYPGICSAEGVLSNKTSSFSYVLCELDACGSGEVKKGFRVNKVRKSLVIMKNGKFLEQRQLTSEEGLC
jgi:hypothetical protein